MAKDIDDMEHERMVARICGLPEPAQPAIGAKTLLAAKPRPNDWEWAACAVPKPSHSVATDSDRGAQVQGKDAR